MVCSVASHMPRLQLGKGERFQLTLVAAALLAAAGQLLDPLDAPDVTLDPPGVTLVVTTLLSLVAEPAADWSFAPVVTVTL